MTAAPRPTDVVELVTVGTELLLGFTVDTNSAELGTALAALGVMVVRRTAVADGADAIRDAVDAALTRTGAVIVTGGLGPTRDDITKHVVAELLGMPLAFHEPIWDELLARYARAGRPMPESNRSQAMVPAGGTVLPNRWGSAPGLWLDHPRGLVVMLPGVPLEMRKLLAHEVAPRLAARAGTRVIRSRTLRTSGIGESLLAETIGDLEDALAPLSLAYLPQVGSVDLRLTAWDAGAEEADRLLADGEARLVARVGEWVWGRGDDDLAEVVLSTLRATGRRLAVAESCTGGMLGMRLTEIVGSSDVFLGGVITYADAAKTTLTGVAAETLAAHGAVSAETAEAMARGVAARLGAEVAVAITGIAGPGGGSEAKPVGTVWFAFLDGDGVETVRTFFPGTRGEVRQRAVQAALLGLWRRRRST